MQDALERPVHYRIFNTATWGPREHAECRARLQELAGPHPSLGDIPRETVIRVFSPHALVALHGDPDAKLVAGVTGTTVWNVRPVHALSQRQHENLLRGEFFLPFTDHPEERALQLDPGGKLLRPARWAHWLEHPCDEVSVTFDVGFYTRTDLRDRKVYDVNWLLRKAHLAPGGPGGRSDRAKCLAFDAISTATRRGLQYRGTVSTRAGVCSCSTGDTRAGLEIARRLHRLGERVVIASSEAAASGMRTRAAEDTLVLPDPRTAFDAYADGIVAALAPGDVAMCTGERALEALRARRAAITGRGDRGRRLAGAGPTIAGSKQLTPRTAAARRHRFRRSLSATARRRARGPDELGYPLVLKPLLASWQALPGGGGEHGGADALPTTAQGSRRRRTPSRSRPMPSAAPAGSERIA